VTFRRVTFQIFPVSWGRASTKI